MVQPSAARNTTFLKQTKKMTIGFFFEILLLLPGFYGQAPLFIDSRCHIVVWREVCRAGKFPQI